MVTQSGSGTSIAQRFESYRPSETLLVWACVVTAVATMIIGFSWGGWVMGGTSRTAAATAGDIARAELASAICVQRFNRAPDAASKLIEFKAIPDSYKKRQFIDAGGWAMMPGQTTSDSRNIEGCATALSL